MSEQDHEDTTVGGVTWHLSEPDSGPDVGLSIYLGPNDRLWAGEISKRLFEERCGPLLFDNDGGWFLIRYHGEDTKLIAKFSDATEAQEFGLSATNSCNTFEKVC